MSKNILNRQDYIDAQASEKITLVHVEATTRLIDWIDEGSNIWSRVTSAFVVGLKENDTDYSKVSLIGSVIANTFFYSPHESKVTIFHIGDPGLQEMVVTYRYFFSDAPVTASWDVTDTGSHVHYQGRITSAPGYSHKVGYEQKLTSIIGKGTVKLENNDGGLDDIFDTVFFENREVRVYSWHRNLNFSEAQVIYRGRVTNKKYTSNTIEFKVKDTLYDLNQNIPQDVYDDNDNVNGDVKGRYKRWVYGRVDGLKFQSVDQIGEGYLITGTVSADTTIETLTGVGTAFLSEVSPGDSILIDTQEFGIESVDSDTSLTLDNKPKYPFTTLPCVLTPEIPTVVKNREFFVVGHASATLTKTVVGVKQLNRIVVSDVVGLNAGDFVEFNTGERIEIKNTAPGNIIVLRQNIIQIPTVGSDVVRQPIQRVFIESQIVPDERYNILNLGGTTKETKITFDADVEFQLARTSQFGFDAAFSLGSRLISYTGELDLREILSPRDYIRPSDISYTTFYEILDVTENSIVLRSPFADPTITFATEGRKPNYLSDDTVVSGNVLGRTIDGEPSGEWLQTASDVVLDLLGTLDITGINQQSFIDASNDNSALISMALPLSISGGAPTTKSVVDDINKTAVAALTLDNDLQLKYKVLLPELDPNIETVYDEDVIKWSIQTTNNDQIRNMIVNYRHRDIDRATQEVGNNTTTFQSEFVRRYIGTNATDTLAVYVYDQIRAEIRSHREVYYRSLGRADLVIDSDLRLERFEIGDQVIVDFERLYGRLGDGAVRKKVCVIVGKKVTGKGIRFELTDMGNIFNRSSIITPNDAPDYNVSSIEEKLKYGYITDNRGITDDNEETANIHLIS